MHAQTERRCSRQPSPFRDIRASCDRRRRETGTHPHSRSRPDLHQRSDCGKSGCRGRATEARLWRPGDIGTWESTVRSLTPVRQAMASLKWPRAAVDMSHGRSAIGTVLGRTWTGGPMASRTSGKTRPVERPARVRDPRSSAICVHQGLPCRRQAYAARMLLNHGHLRTA